MLSQQAFSGGRRRALRFVTAAVVTTLAMALAPVSVSAAEPGDLTGTGVTPTDQQSGSKSPTSRLAQSDPAVLAATGTDRVSLLVKLDYDSVATYAGGVQGLQPTSPTATERKLDQQSDAVNQYEAYAAGVEDSFTAELSTVIPDATVGTRLRTVYGGLAVTVPADRAKDLLTLPGVVAVQADPVNHILTDSSPDFLGAPTLYAALGTDSTGTTAGQGTIVGVLDTGVWPEHPSFTPNPSIGAPPAKADGTPRVCDFGDNPLTPAADVFQCNNKLISGEAFLQTYNATATQPEVYSTARDSNGHGTHTSSTAAGSPVTEATIFGVDRGPIHGIAPGAYIAAYKVCGLQGCFGSDTAAAVGQAIKDGVDVINFSISGGAQPFQDATELAFLDAYADGIFVSASAGNSGPGAGTTDHQGPWVTTVAASTQQRTFESTLTVTSGTDTFTTKGASLTPGVPDATPIVLASAAPYSSVLCDTQAPPGTFTGKIVACQRGGNGRVEKGFNVLHGGAVGMVLYNPALADVETDNHFLPAVHLADGSEFLAFLTAHAGATASFTAGVRGTGQGDVMAAFSSRGPGGNWLKPDVTAPGVEILAGNTPTPDEVAGGPPGQYFQAIAGTSMSSPHVAGSAALIAALHPDWTPGQIKSALMTTAKTTVVKEDLTTPADPFDDGSGRIDLTKAGDPGLTFDVDAADFAAAENDKRAGVDLNVPSINVPVLAGSITTTRTAKNVTDHRVRYRAVTTSPEGARISVWPSVFTLKPGETAKLRIRIDGASLPVGDTFYFGQVLLDEIGARHDVHLPVAFKRGQGVVTLAASCAPTELTLSPRIESTCSVTAANSASTPTTVDVSSSVDNRLRVTSITGADTDRRGGVRLPTTSLVGKKVGIPGISPGASPDGYVALAAFGFAPTAVGDEDIVNFTIPAFDYAGDTYTKIGVTSNGYLVVGGGTIADVAFDPQTLPDPAAPNNVLAPFWTDLNGTGAPGITAGVLGDGTNSWIVVEWQVNVFGTTDLKAFQTWIGINGTEDITYAYDPAHPPTTPVGQPLTIGAENIDGSGGAQITGLPAGDLRVSSTDGAPGGSVSYQFTVRGKRTGTATVTTTLTSPDVVGKAKVLNAIEVNRP